MNKKPVSLEAGFSCYFLFAEAEFRDGLFVEIEIGFFEVFQEFFALPDHLHETSFSHKVMFVGFDVFRDLFDPFRQNRNLNFRRTDVGLRTGDLGNSFVFILFCDHSEIIISLNAEIFKSFCGF